MSDNQGLRMKYFVLKPEGTDIFAQASRRAMRTYAALIEDDGLDPSGENKKFATELREWADREFAAAIEAGMHNMPADRWGF